MKKSYHSIVVPIVDAMTALRNCLLCSDADNPLCGMVSNVVVFAIVFPSVPFTLEQLLLSLSVLSVYLYRWFRFSCVQLDSPEPRQVNPWIWRKRSATWSGQMTSKRS